MKNRLFYSIILIFVIFNSLYNNLGSVSQAEEAHSINDEYGDEGIEASTYRFDCVDIDVSPVSAGQVPKLGRTGNSLLLIIKVKNNSEFDIKDWYLIADVEYEFLTSDALDIYKYDSYSMLLSAPDDVLKSKAERDFYIAVDSYAEKGNYLLYGSIIQSDGMTDFYYDGLDDSLIMDAVDSVEVDILENTESLAIYDPDAYNASLQDTFDDEININEVEDYVYETDTNKIIDSDNRVLVDDPRSGRNSAIGLIYIRYKDGSGAYSTGAMIGQNVMLTTAHSIYKGKKKIKTIDVYFGVDGESYFAHYKGKKYGYSVAYVKNQTVANDWGYIVFKTKDKVGKKTGWFGLSYTKNWLLEKKQLTLTGYPYDKSFEFGNYGVNGRMFYLYTHSRKPYKVYDKTLTYQIDATSGQSGSPIYDKKYNIYGIHKGAVKDKNLNQGRKITKALYQFLYDKGYVGTGKK